MFCCVFYLNIQQIFSILDLSCYAMYAQVSHTISFMTCIFASVLGSLCKELLLKDRNIHLYLTYAVLVCISVWLHSLADVQKRSRGVLCQTLSWIACECIVVRYLLFTATLLSVSWRTQKSSWISFANFLGFYGLFESYWVSSKIIERESQNFSIMSGNPGNGFSSFGRRPQDDGESLSSMRERMDRDREAFFADRPAQGRPWQPFFQVREIMHLPVIVFGPPCISAFL